MLKEPHVPCNGNSVIAEAESCKLISRANNISITYSTSNGHVQVFISVSLLLVVLEDRSKKRLYTSNIKKKKKKWRHLFTSLTLMICTYLTFSPLLFPKLDLWAPSSNYQIWRTLYRKVTRYNLELSKIETVETKCNCYRRGNWNRRAVFNSGLVCCVHFCINSLEKAINITLHPHAVG